MKIYNPMDVIRALTGNDLTEYKVNQSKASLPTLAANKSKNKGRKFGRIFVTRSKEQLLNKQSFIITSYETLSEQYNHLSHFTPNTYTYGTYRDPYKKHAIGFNNGNLKQVSTFGFDFDTKNLDLYTLFLAAVEKGLPAPTAILETPRGYNVFYTVKTPFFITQKTDRKALKVAESIAKNLKSALSEVLKPGILDKSCTPFGFFRIPKENNIVYFEEENAIETSELIAWSIKYSKENNKPRMRLIVSNQDTQPLHTHSNWYRDLLTSTHITSGLHGRSRNNALFTLALANYADNIPFEQAFDELDQFNSNLEQPLSYREFKSTIKSAYAGKKLGPSRDYVENLSAEWLDNTVSYTSFNGWYKHAKKREERVRSHYDEWEEDLISFLEARTGPQEPFFNESLKNIARLLQMPVSSLKEVLKRSKRVVKQVKGKGRASKTFLAIKTNLFKHLLFLRKEKTNQANEFFYALKSHKVLNQKEEVIAAQLVDVYSKTKIRNYKRYAVGGRDGPILI